MGLAASTFKIRSQLLNVFQRTWPHGLDMKVSEVKGIMLKIWLVERRQQRKMRASGVNNYIRMFQGLFKIAVALVEMSAICRFLTNFVRVFYGPD